MRLELDNIDQTILSLLTRDARTPFLEIARECKVSGAAIHSRVKKLEEAGILLGSMFEVDHKALGYETVAFASISTNGAMTLDELTDEIKKVGGVVECHYVSGSLSLWAKLLCVDNNHLISIVVNEIQAIKGVIDVDVSVSLKQIIKREIGF